VDVVLIAALTRARVIGRDGQTPWHYPVDLRNFRLTTRGHPVLMGRRTWESLPRRPLPERPNIVLSRRPALDLEPGAVHCHSLPEALQWCVDRGHRCAFVAGGAQLYRVALPVACCLLLTWVPDNVPGDALFPEFDVADWDVVDSRCEGGLTFVTYRRPAPERGLAQTPTTSRG
jgi:dihydrofolate reductase